MSADEAKRRAWWRLRRAILNRQDNPGAREWEEINDRNNFGPSVEETMRRWVRG